MRADSADGTATPCHLALEQRDLLIILQDVGLRGSRNRPIRRKCRVRWQLPFFSSAQSVENKSRPRKQPWARKSVVNSVRPPSSPVPLVERLRRQSRRSLPRAKAPPSRPRKNKQTLQIAPR